MKTVFTFTPSYSSKIRLYSRYSPITHWFTKYNSFRYYHFQFLAVMIAFKIPLLPPPPYSSQTWEITHIEGVLL